MLRRSAPSRLPVLRVGDLELNTVTRTKLGEDDWLILDSLPMTIEGKSIRVVASCAQIGQTLGIPVLAALIGFRIAKRSLSPIRRIIACADEIAGGDLSRRVPEESTKGELTRTLNRMLSSLEDSFRRARRFTSDASHELRAPVAVILAYAESLRANASLPAAGFRTRRPDCARSRAIEFRSCRKFAAADTNMK